jgi:hypothetical protein
MVPAQAGFWESLLRPIRSDTSVTPTIAVIKLVTPLSLVLASFAKEPVNSSLFLLGAAPVATVLLQILFLTFTGKIEHLESEPHKERMRELENRFGSNDGDGSRDMKLAKTRLTDNPKMKIGETVEPPMIERNA